jgi:hypothetical protein
MNGQGALRHWIDGAEAVGDRRERIAVVNPATATVIADAPARRRVRLRRPGRRGRAARSRSGRLCRPIPSIGHPVVEELGLGTGAFSRTIQERLDGRGWHIALDV